MAKGKSPTTRDTSKETGKSCFIISPIGIEGSETRRRIDGHLELVYRPVMKELGYDKVLASHEESKLGSITQQVIGHLFNDDMVIADLSTVNANVMYELSVRHAVHKPVVTVAVEGTEIPFDIKDDRHLMFPNDAMGLVKLKNELPVIVKEAENDKNHDNPISRYAKYKAIIETPGTSEIDRDKYFIEELNEIKTRLDQISTPQKTKNPRLPGDDAWDDFNLDTIQGRLKAYPVSVTIVIDENANKDAILNNIRQKMSSYYSASVELDNLGDNRYRFRSIMGESIKDTRNYFALLNEIMEMDGVKLSYTVGKSFHSAK